MDSYYIPTSYSQAEITEKRSRFIGRVWPASNEEEAKMLIAKTKKEFFDARHTCWCYSIKETGQVRYSDDGEPQGTAGQPMLDVFQRKGLDNFCCTVTRYFGGILLGTGGLVRAYSQTAALALKGSGISIVQLWKQIELECSYSFYERVKPILSAYSGIIDNTDYSGNVLLSILLPFEKAKLFTDKITDASAGTAFCLEAGEIYRPAVFIEPEE